MLVFPNFNPWLLSSILSKISPEFSKDSPRNSFKGFSWNSFKDFCSFSAVVFQDCSANFSRDSQKDTSENFSRVSGENLTRISRRFFQSMPLCILLNNGSFRNFVRIFSAGLQEFLQKLNKWFLREFFKFIYCIFLKGLLHKFPGIICSKDSSANS